MFRESGFFNSYENMQITTIITDPITGQLKPIRANAGEAESYGVEAELVARVIEPSVITAGVGYLHSEYTSLLPSVAATTVSLSDKIPYAPTWSGNLSAAYTFDLGDLGHVTARGDVAYRSTTHFSLKTRPQTTQGSYSLVNARVSYTPASENWDVSVFASNLFDKVYLESAQDIGELGIYQHLTGAPRFWGVGLNYRF